MTTVTVDNYGELFPTVVQAIRRSTFVAVDTELTGLVADIKLEPSLFDSPNERYKKQRTSVSKLAMVQFGLTTFEKIEGEPRFETESFTFYLCPRTWSESRGKLVCFEQGAIEFLGDNNFDFEKCIKQGISYLNESEEEQVRADLMSGGDLVSSLVTGGSSNRDQYLSLFTEISAWLEDSRMAGDNTPESNQLVLPITVSSVNRFKTWALVRELRANFEDAFIRHVDQHILVRRLASEDERPFQLQVYRDDQAAAIDYLLGLTRLFRQLVEARKPLVGHNLMVDLLHMYHHLYRPLPNTLKEFKETLHRLFPRILDTKSIFLNIRRELPLTHRLVAAAPLGQLYTSAQTWTKDKYQPKLSSVLQVEHKLHEAGFDSLASGTLLIRLAYEFTASRIKGDRVPSWLECFMALEPNWNQINLIRADRHYLRLDSGDEDKTPRTRPPWLLVQSRSREALSITKITGLLAPFGCVDVRRWGRREALVSVGNYPTARDILSAFDHDKELLVTVFNEWKHDPRRRAALWFSLVVGCSASLVSAFYLARLCRGS